MKQWWPSTKPKQKTLGDLKPGDFFYFLESPGELCLMISCETYEKELRQASISTKYLKFGSDKVALTGWSADRPVRCVNVVIMEDER